MTAHIDKNTVQPGDILGELERVSAGGNPTYVDAHHTAMHEAIAATIEVLTIAVNSGATAAGGQELAAIATRLQDIENDLTVVHGVPVPIPGPKGDPGQPGSNGVSVQVVTSTTPPPRPSNGDIWINDITQRPSMWSGGAWNPLSGAAGATGTPGRDGRGIASVTVTMLPYSQAPIAVYNATSQSLALRIPRGDPGPPAMYQSTIPTQAGLPAPAPANAGHIYGVTANNGWYFSTGSQWRLMGHWLQGPKGDEGPSGPAPLIRVGTTTTLPPAQDAAVTITTTGTNTYEFRFSIPKGADGAKGVAGETFSPAGVVTDVTQLPTAPPRLTVLATNDPTTWLWVYDPASPAASRGPAAVGPPMVAPAGWVSLGEVTGPEGPEGPVGPPAHPVVFMAFADDAEVAAYVAAGAAGVPADHAGFFMSRDTATVYGYVDGRTPELVELGSLLSPQSLPAGGGTDQVLMKATDADFDFKWHSPGTIPDGNTDGDGLRWDDTNAAWHATPPVPALPDGNRSASWLRWVNGGWKPSVGIPDGVHPGDLMQWDGTMWLSSEPRGSVYFGHLAPSAWRNPTEGDMWFATRDTVPAVTVPAPPLLVIHEGAPAVLEPASAPVPADLAALTSPYGNHAAWTLVGASVVLGDGTHAHWNGTSWVAGAVPLATANTP